MSTSTPANFGGSSLVSSPTPVSSLIYHWGPPLWQHVFPSHCLSHDLKKALPSHRPGVRRLISLCCRGVPAVCGLAARRNCSESQIKNHFRHHIAAATEDLHPLFGCTFLYNVWNHPLKRSVPLSLCLQRWDHPSTNPLKCPAVHIGPQCALTACDGWANEGHILQESAVKFLLPLHFLCLPRLLASFQVSSPVWNPLATLLFLSWSVYLECYFILLLY